VEDVLEAGGGGQHRGPLVEQRLVDRPAVLEHLHPVDPPEPASPAVFVEDRTANAIGPQTGEGPDRELLLARAEPEPADFPPPAVEAPLDHEDGGEREEEGDD